jgi:RHS repeat-associated protein
MLCHRAGQKPPWSCLAILLIFSQAALSGTLDDEIGRPGVFGAPLLMTAGSSSLAENRALAQALTVYAKSRDGEPEHAIHEFLKRYPASSWRASLLVNLASSYRANGRFTKALDSYEEVWALTENQTGKNEQMLANWALGELLAMHSHLGHATRLEQLFTAAGGREIHGPTTEQLTAARESLWLKQHDPEMSFRCGPMALARLAARMGLGTKVKSMLEDARATANGMSLEQVESLARKAGMGLVAGRREPGASFAVPAIVHWKVDHYSAIVERKIEEGREYFLVENPLFEKEMWVSRQTLDEETSGYYLVPEGRLPAGWRRVAPEEAAGVWGRCFQGSLDLSQTMCYAEMVRTSCGGAGMADYNFHSMLVSLHLADEPLGYSPPRGPAVHFTVTYNQRDAFQPAAFAFSNLGAKWTFDWISYASDSGGNQPASLVTVYLRGGGQETYERQSQTSIPGKSYTTNYNTDYMSHAQMVGNSTGSAPPVYERWLPDGSKEVFGQPDKTAAGKRRLFLTQIVDPAGNAIKLTYDSSFRVVSVTDALGQVTRLSYDLAADPLKVTKVTDPFGRFCALTYNPQGQLTGITDVAGITSQFTYVNGDFISSMTTPYGVTTFRSGVAPGQDPIGGVNRSLDAFDPLGGQERLEFRFYDPTTANVYGSSLYWDKRAMATSPGDPAAAKVVNWALDSRLSVGIKHYEKSPLESQIRYSYSDTRGKLTAEGTTSGEPNFIGLPVQIVKKLDDGTSQTYQVKHNPRGKPVQVIDPMGRTTSLDYDAAGIDLLEVHNGSDNNATLARFAYNSQHLPLTYTDAAGQTTAYTYNPQGQLLTVTNAKRETTTYTYDFNGYLTRITGPIPSAAASYTYDRFGRLQTAIDSEGYKLTYNYDLLDRLTGVTYPDGTFEQITYDRLDPVQWRDRLGRIWQASYDALRRPVSFTDPLGRTTQLAWCGCGALEQLIDAAGNTTSWAYDLAGRVISKTLPDQSQIQYIYEANTNRLKSMTDARGQVTTYQYTADDNVLQIAFVNANIPTAPIRLTYDPKWNRLVKMDDGVGATQFTYVAPGARGATQVSSVAGPVPGTQIDYQYDELGRPLTRSVNGVAASLAYDPMGRITNVNNVLGAFRFSYLGATPQVSQAFYPNGQRSTWTYFDSTGDRRLKSLVHEVPGSNVLSQFQYAYSSAGEIKQITRTQPELPQPSSVLGFQNDLASQLAAASLNGPGGSAIGQFAYTFDLAGNRTQESSPSGTQSATYNNLNQLSALTRSDGDRQYSYDANGNLLSDGVRSFEWDARDRLTAVVSGTHRTEFTYDGLDRRVRVIEKEGGSPVTDIWQVWCGGAICEERDAQAGATLKRYFSFGETAGNAPLYYTTDHLSSIRQLTNSAGAVVASYDYDPYGRLQPAAGDPAPGRAFAGYPNHAPSGLYLTQYRAYDPDLGVWLSRDPIGEAGGVNLYAYVSGDPVNGIDPLGLSGNGGGLVNIAISWWRDLTFANELEYRFSILQSGAEIVAEPALDAYAVVGAVQGIAGLGFAARNGLVCLRNRLPTFKTSADRIGHILEHYTPGPNQSSFFPGTDLSEILQAARQAPARVQQVFRGERTLVRTFPFREPVGIDASPDLRCNINQVTRMVTVITRQTGLERLLNTERVWTSFPGFPRR